MLALKYSLRLSAKVPQFQDADFAVSPPFDPSEVIICLINRLGALGYVPDGAPIQYIMKEDGLFAEGTAVQEQPPPEADCIF